MDDKLLTIKAISIEFGLSYTVAEGLVASVPHDDVKKISGIDRRCWKYSTVKERLELKNSLPNEVPEGYTNKRNIRHLWRTHQSKVDIWFAHEKWPGSAGKYLSNGGKQIDYYSISEIKKFLFDNDFQVFMKGSGKPREITIIANVGYGRIPNNHINKIAHRAFNVRAT